MKKTIINTFILLNLTFGLFAQKTGTITDDRDGKAYATVVIDDQTWMAENLTFEATEGCWAYGDDEGNVEVYGRLYSWESATTSCPAGWHLPNDEEWDKLIVFLGGPLSAGSKLKAKGTENWAEPNVATNESGFSALPGGKFVHEEFMNLNKIATFWTETASSGHKAHCKGFRNKTETVKSSDGFDTEGRSVRCIKD
ncbi:MAG: hypothetical protein DRJ05_01530 [Bacteroidetes bacterium]|nr:MAG: hypothetical protein DRJ05_01530 [Bacteroidota bacterium]